MAAQLHFGAGDSLGFGTTGAGGSGTGSFSKSAISNMVVGDLLVAWIHNQSSGAGGTITAPSGWTRYGAALGTPNFSASRLSGFYYYALKSQADIDNLPVTNTWTFSVTTTRVACEVARATGIDLDHIEDAAATAFTSAGGASLSIVGIATNSASTLLVGGVHHQNSASTTSPSTTSFMTAFEEYKTSPTGSANANSGGVLGYTELTAAGATGNVVATFDSTTTAAGGELAAFTVGAWTAPATNPYIVGTSTTYLNSNPVTSFTIGKPTGYQDGDLMILALSSQSSTVTADFACSGWSRISQPFAASSSAYRLVAFYALPIPTASALTTSNFTFTSSDSSVGGRIAAEVFIIRGADLNSIATATSPYGGNASQIVTVAPTAPVVNSNLLLVAYSAQFTSAIDYTLGAGPAGMTQQVSLISSTGAQSKTALAVYQQNVDAGATGNKSLTWNGTFSQASGVAVAIRASGMVAPNPGVPIKYTSATDTLGNANLFYTSATDTLSTPLEVRPMPTGYTSVAAMLATTPFYVAHRGGSANWPEMSLHAYTQSVFWGVGALEISLARTSDGVWFGLHDATLDRTSGTTGFTASAHTWAEVQAYQITAAGTTNSSQGAKPYMRWEELMAAYYTTHVIFVDPKAALAYSNELLDMMDAMPGSPTTRFVGKYYGIVGNAANTTGWAHDLAARGYHRWGYFYQADAANFATYQGRWDILGMDYNADQATWTSILSYGKPVIGHITPSLAAATTALNFGAAGIMASGVQQVAPRTP